MQLASARARENFHFKVLMRKVGTSVHVDRKLRPRKRRVNYMKKSQVIAKRWFSVLWLSMKILRHFFYCGHKNYDQKFKPNKKKP